MSIPENKILAVNDLNTLFSMSWRTSTPNLGVTKETLNELIEDGLEISTTVTEAKRLITKANLVYDDSGSDDSGSDDETTVFTNPKFQYPIGWSGIQELSFSKTKKDDEYVTYSLNTTNSIGLYGHLYLTPANENLKKATSYTITTGISGANYITITIMYSKSIVKDNTSTDITLILEYSIPYTNTITVDYTYSNYWENGYFAIPLTTLNATVTGTLVIPNNSSQPDVFTISKSDTDINDSLFLYTPSSVGMSECVITNTSV